MKKKGNKKLYVSGMHCASCELIIERKMDKIGIDAQVSLKDKTVTLKNASGIGLDELNKNFQDLGYTFDTNKQKEDHSQAWKMGLSAGLLILALFYLLDKTNLMAYISVSETSALPLFFLFGLAAGMSSCAALVGGLLLSLGKKWHEELAGEPYFKRAQPFILFNAGRLVSFGIFGGILGLLGSAIQISLGLSALMVIGVSLLTILVGLQMLQVPFFKDFAIKLPKSITQKAADPDTVRGKFMPFASGALTFLLPCGFTLTAQSAALLSGSFGKGTMIMTLFALGTLPMLASISASSLAFTKKAKTAGAFNYAAGLLIVLMGVYSINSQLNVLGWPSLSDLRVKADQRTTKVKGLGTAGNASEQLMQLEATSFAYNPTYFQIRAGVPTKLEIYNSGARGCAQALAARGLIPGMVTLKPGLNTVKFTPKKGVYKISCTMGMVPPVTVEVL